MSDLAQALLVAIKIHADQRDKQGAPYLLHVLRVVEAVNSYDAKVVAALHDVVEDGDLTLSEVCELVGCDEDERQALKAITRWGDEYGIYIDRMARWGGASGSIAREVKLADLRDHLQHMPSHSDQWGWPVTLRKRYERAITILEGTT